MKYLISEEITKEKQKSPIKEQIGALEALKKEVIIFYINNYKENKRDNNEIKTNDQDNENISKSKIILVFISCLNIFIVIIKSNLDSKIEIIIFCGKIEYNYNSKIIYKLDSKIRIKEISFASKTIISDNNTFSSSDILGEEKRKKVSSEIKMRYNLIGSFENKIKTRKYCNLKKLDNNINNINYDNDKRNIISNKIIIRNQFKKILLIYYLLINFINSVFSFQNSQRKLLTKYSYITLKIYGTGNKYIYYSTKNCNCENPAPYIDEIYINGVRQTNVKNNYDFNSGENNITLIWKNNINNVRCMFCGCSYINEIDLSKFDSSDVTDAFSMFAFCSSLTSIDFNEFDAQKITNIMNMFEGCSSLKYINLKNLILSDNCNTNYMFNGTSNQLIICANNMEIIESFGGNKFIDCINYYDMMNYKIYIEFECYKKSSNTETYTNICEKCGINYYQINSITDNTVINCVKGSDDINKNSCYETCKTCDNNGNITIHNCIECNDNYIYELNISNYKNCYNICPYYYYKDTKLNKNYCTYNLSCPTNYPKLIENKNKCINNCNNDQLYKYEFKNKCYKECPMNISYKSDNNYCEISCTKEFPYEIIETQECVNNCSNYEIINGLCKINNNELAKELEEKIIDNLIKELTKDFDTSKIDKGENIVIKQKYSTITITTTENQKNEKLLNVTSIDLGECENIIKEEYNITKNKSLYLLKIDVKQEGYKIPKIEYEVYYPLFNTSLIKLNLTSCESTKINLKIPVLLADSLDIMNSSSKYYSDICYTYTSSDGTDISLLDRKKDFVNKNLTVCEEDCDFIDYNYTIEKATCSCKVKMNSNIKIAGIEINKDKLFNSFTNFKNIANIHVLKCYELIFKLDAYKYNYANILLPCIILLLIICFIIFYCKDYSYLMKIMNNITYLKLNPKLEKKLEKRNMKENNIGNKKYFSKNNKKKKKIRGEQRNLKIQKQKQLFLM